jgi:L-threonylcarbamoyladenylate synthase
MAPAPSWHLRLARHHIEAGGIVAYPTESVWGLGCDPHARDAVERLLELKQRPVTLGLILIGASYEQIAPYIDTGMIDRAALDRARRSWPGPTTWLLPAADTVPPWIRGRHASVALRVTAHPVAAALCATVGRAIVSTSANIHGRRPPRTALRLRAGLGRQVDYILPGATGGAPRPTRIRDALSGRTLRPG